MRIKLTLPKKFLLSSFFSWACWTICMLFGTNKAVENFLMIVSIISTLLLVMAARSKVAEEFAPVRTNGQVLQINHEQIAIFPSKIESAVGLINGEGRVDDVFVIVNEKVGNNNLYRVDQYGETVWRNEDIGEPVVDIDFLPELDLVIMFTEHKVALIEIGSGEVTYKAERRS